jgi:transcriptional regulator with XRE-family HTH domain
MTKPRLERAHYDTPPPWAAALANLPPLGTFKERLAFLIETVHPAGRGPYTHDEIEARIQRGLTAAGERVDAQLRPHYRLSASSIGNWASGRTGNPGRQQIQALAAFFHVPPAFFFDDEASKRIAAQIRYIAVRIEAADDVEIIAHRAAQMSPQQRKLLRETVERMALDDAEHPDPHGGQS